uniref:Serpentine receptor class gamma n=1 Tax=Strongyloides papillosus TaxID=174720 RepID=A0A0N5BP37_STREA
MMRISVFIEIIQIVYTIPTTLLMILTIFVIMKEIRRKNNYFNRQFYLIIVCKLINDIAYVLTKVIFFKLPKLGYFHAFLLKNNWVAAMYSVLTTMQTTLIYLMTLLISLNRYIALKYPITYKYYFSTSNMTQLLIFCTLLSTLTGIGTAFYPSTYGIQLVAGYFMPFYTNRKVFYYLVVNTIILYGVIFFGTCVFNVLAIVELIKHKKLCINSNKNKRESMHIIYSIFVFITLAFIEAFFIFRILGMVLDSAFFEALGQFLLIWVFDITSIGDFYFLIFIR